MWERELKRARIVALWFILELLPTWERELKRKTENRGRITGTQLFPTWERELKQAYSKLFALRLFIAPCMGA